jgi:hypothetical protein
VESESQALSERERFLQQKARGWSSRAAQLVTGWIVFLTLTGFAIELLPFSTFNQHAVLTHTLIGLVFVPLFAVFLVRHVRAWWHLALTQVKFTGWLSAAATVVLIVSGVVLTAQGVFGTRITYDWRLAHIVATLAMLLFLVPHYAALAARELRQGENANPTVVPALKSHARVATFAGLACFAATGALCVVVRPATYRNEFPPEYERDPYAGAGPFAPSLAKTATGGAFDSRSLSGSAACGTSGCHEQIYREWQPTAHRYAAMDAAFQAIQGLMAQQNGATSTRYCAGCHDPISLFSGTKYIGVEHLTGLAGYQEGVSCLACHAIEQTDVAGNANYVMHQPDRYVWELRDGPLAQALRDFTIRTYPDHHVATLSHRMFKTPEFCAACHKQFIDEKVNKVGWVQLQNQYDNWKASRWNHVGDPSQTLECRECHMPLVDSTDPAAGDDADFNRNARDGKHRSHRFLGANQFMPSFMKLEGGEQQAQLVTQWLRGELEVPEIAERWRSGPAVPIELDVPLSVKAGESVPLRVHILNNKVGHDFPTGPLDIIQAWVEVEVSDASGKVLFHTGSVDERNFIEAGTFMFKAEPVDRYGNLIDRHNLWEMVGVRFKRALFPGAAEVARFEFPCPGGQNESVQDLPVVQTHELSVPADAIGELTVEAKLNYRKVDQYLANFAFGEKSGVRAPSTVVSSAHAKIRVTSTADAR